jgi:hypothetical protein
MGLICCDTSIFFIIDDGGLTPTFSEVALSPLTGDKGLFEADVNFSVTIMYWEHVAYYYYLWGYGAAAGYLGNEGKQ